MDLTQLNGVGPALATKLDKLGLRNVEDLLFHLPIRYQDRTRLVPLHALRPKTACLVDLNLIKTVNKAIPKKE